MASEQLIPGLWLLFIAYWIYAGKSVRPAKRQESLGSRLSHGILFGLAAVLLFFRVDIGPSAIVWLPRSNVTAAIAVLLTASGVGFAIWARTVLGQNWSGRVTLKQGHELIQRGPYALVRHPIYTGLLCAILGSALAAGQLRGLLALALFVAGVFLKIRLEEKWLSDEFGDAYLAYRRRVKALIPLVA